MKKTIKVKDNLSLRIYSRWQIWDNNEILLGDFDNEEIAKGYFTRLLKARTQKVKK